MIRFYLKKILTLLFSLFLITTLTFGIMKAIPGDPFIEENVITKEILDALHKHYGLDDPLYVQYLKYLKGFLTFDLGPSLIYEGRTVNQILCEGFPVSAALGCEAILLSLFLGVTLGSFAAIKRGKWQDKSTMMISMIGLSLPNFLIATLLQYILCLKFNLFPVARWGTFTHTILPTLTLSALPTAFIARLTRSSLIEVLEQDYIKLAYAKGLSVFRVVIVHGLRNAILPTISYLGTITTHVLTGSFIVEKIFGIPGLGQWLIVSISNRDYPVILGLTVFFSVLLVVVIFFVDIVYSFVDPRIKTLPQKHLYVQKNFSSPL